MAKNVSDAFFLWYPLLVACGLLAGAGVVQGYYLASNWSQNQPSAHAEESAGMNRVIDGIRTVQRRASILTMLPALISRDSHTTDDDQRSAEDERAVILAKRARGGDWDDGKYRVRLDTKSSTFAVSKKLTHSDSDYVNRSRTRTADS